MRFKTFLFALSAGLLAAPGFGSAARGEDISAASVGLRAGYDSNPANIEGGRGGAFVAHAVAWDFLRGTEKDGFGVSVSLSGATYDPRSLAPSQNNAATFKHAAGLAPESLLRSTLSATNEQSWSRRRNDLLWRERVDHEYGSLRLFLAADARLSSLNERNIFALGGFLPRDESFATFGLLPGAAWRFPGGEIGASLSLSRVRYLHGEDYLGFRRSHDRATPNLFGSFSLLGATVEGSLSAFNAIFPDKDFDPVRRILYTAKATIPIAKATIALSSARAPEDTTLPLSVIDLVTTHEARVSTPIAERHRLDLFARMKTDDYVGLGARSSTLSLGLDYQRRLADGVAAVAGLSWRRTVETGALPARAIAFNVGLQKQIDLAGAKSESAPQAR